MNRLVRKRTIIAGMETRESALGTGPDPRTWTLAGADGPPDPARAAHSARLAFKAEGAAQGLRRSGWARPEGGPLPHPASTRRPAPQPGPSPGQRHRGNRWAGRLRDWGTLPMPRGAVPSAPAPRPSPPAHSPLLPTRPAPSTASLMSFGGRQSEEDSGMGVSRKCPDMVGSRMELDLGGGAGRKAGRGRARNRSLEPLSAAWSPVLETRPAARPAAFKGLHGRSAGAPSSSPPSRPCAPPGSQCAASCPVARGRPLSLAALTGP